MTDAEKELICVALRVKASIHRMPDGTRMRYEQTDASLALAEAIACEDLAARIERGEILMFTHANVPDALKTRPHHPQFSYLELYALYQETIDRAIRAGFNQSAEGMNADHGGAPANLIAAARAELFPR